MLAISCYSSTVTSHQAAGSVYNYLTISCSYYDYPDVPHHSIISSSMILHTKPAEYNQNKTITRNDNDATGHYVEMHRKNESI